MNWGLIAAVAGWALAVAVGLVALYITNGQNIEATKEAVAKIIGDALALVAAYAKTFAGTLNDAQLDGFSGAVYDFWIEALPDSLSSAVLTFYPRAAFQAIFRRVWREYCARRAEMEAKALAAIKMPESGYFTR